MIKKNIIILLLFTIMIFSCKSKKQADCPSFDIEEDVKKNDKKERSKYKILILRDGKSIFKRKKRKKKVKMF